MVQQRRQPAGVPGAHLLDQYAAHVGIAPADYKTMLVGEPGAVLLAHDTFSQYRAAFDRSTEITNLKKQKGFKAKSDDEQSAELDKRFLAFIQTIERDKLFHFVLASQQPNPVLIIKSPTDTKAQRQFLGYDWSSAKGSEGIKLIKDAHGHHLTLMYDEADRDNPGKINRCIAENFDGKLAAVPAELSDYVNTARLVDMLDFSRVMFEKQISLNAQRAFQVESKWPLAKISDLVEIISGGTPDTGNSLYWNGDIPWLSVADFSTKERFVSSAEKSISKDGLKNSSTKLLQVGDIIISARGTVGALAQLQTAMAFNQSCYGLRSKTNISNDYIFYSLKREIQQLKSQAFGSKFDAITIKTFGEVNLPVPPSIIQQQIVTECEVLDAEAAVAHDRIGAERQSIESQVNAIYASNAPRLEIDKLSLSVQYGLNEKMNEAGIGYKIFRMNEIIQRRMVDNGSMKCADISTGEFAKYRLNRGDLLFNRTNSIEHVGKTGLFDLDGEYCFASYLVRVVPDPRQVLPLFLTLLMNSKEFQQEAKGKASKSINQANINATIMRNIKVPVPPLPEQQRLVAEVETLEESIAEAQTITAAASAKKQAVMQRYL